MTKRKTAPFRGAWMSSHLIEPRPIPAWASVEQANAMHADARRKDDAEWRKVERLAEALLGTTDVGAVMAALRRAVEIWRFENQRYRADPEPAQWQGLVRAIEVPDSVDWRAVDAIRRAVDALPAHVRAVLDGVLFERAEMGAAALFERMMRTAAADGAAAAGDVALIRGALRDMAEALDGLKAKRGPRLRPVVARALREVHAAVAATSSIGDAPARAVAAELLRGVHIPAPESTSRLAAIFRTR